MVRKNFQFANSRMLFNLLQCKRDEILLFNLIDDHSFDHLGLRILDFSKVRSKIPDIPDDPHDEQKILAYIRSQNHDTLKIIGNQLESKEDKQLWAKRKRYYIFFIATETDLPTRFLEFYTNGDEEEDDESLLSHSTSITENKIEHGISGMSTYLKNISYSDLPDRDRNTPYFDIAFRKNKIDNIEIADYPDPIKFSRHKSQPNSDGDKEDKKPYQQMLEDDIEIMNSIKKRGIRRKMSAYMLEDMKKDLGFATALKIHTSENQATPIQEAHKKFMTKNNKKMIVGKFNTDVEDDSSTDSYSNNEHIGSDEHIDSDNDSLIARGDFDDELEGDEEERNSKHMLLEEKNVEEKSITGFMDKMKTWKSQSMKRFMKQNSLQLKEPHNILSNPKKTSLNSFGPNNRNKQKTKFQKSKLKQKKGNADLNFPYVNSQVIHKAGDTAEDEQAEETMLHEINESQEDSEIIETSPFRSPQHLVEEVNNFLAAMRVMGMLIQEKCRETYILKDGRNAFLEKYSYIQASHPSQLYKLMMKPEGIPNEILPNHIWLGNAKHVIPTSNKPEF